MPDREAPCGSMDESPAGITLSFEVSTTNGNQTEFLQRKTKTRLTWMTAAIRISFHGTIPVSFLFSDATGWKHMYFYDMKGNWLTRSPPANSPVTDLTYVDEKRASFTSRHAALENTARNDFYRVNINGRTCLGASQWASNNNINLSPGGSYLLQPYSNASNATPDDAYQQQAEDQKNWATVKAPNSITITSPKQNLFG